MTYDLGIMPDPVKHIYYYRGFGNFTLCEKVGYFATEPGEVNCPWCLYMAYGAKTTNKVEMTMPPNPRNGS